METNPEKIDSGFQMRVEVEEEAGGKLGFSREPRVLERTWRLPLEFWGYG